MTDLHIIEKAIAEDKIPNNMLSKFPSTHLELMLAMSFKHNKNFTFKEIYTRINFNDTSIKTKSNLLNWLINHNLNIEKDFATTMDNKCIIYCLQEGLKFNPSVLSKKFKNIDFYKTFQYCNNITPETFNALFSDALKARDYQALSQRIYDTLDYHQKFNIPIPLKFFEKICCFIIPLFIIAKDTPNNTPNPNPAIQKGQEAISEFIQHFAKNFDFLGHVSSDTFMNMCTGHYNVTNKAELLSFYSSIRETILLKKLDANVNGIKNIPNKKKI